MIDKRQKIMMVIIVIVLLLVIGLFIYFIVTDPEVERDPVNVVQTVQTADN